MVKYTCDQNKYCCIFGGAKRLLVYPCHKTTIKTFIFNGETKEAIEAVLECAKESPFYKEAFELFTRYQRLEREREDIVLSEEERAKSLNRLNEAILDVVDLVLSEKEILEIAPPKKKVKEKSKWWWF